MKSNYITIYSLDFKTVYTIHYQGFFSFREINPGFDDCIISGYDYLYVYQNRAWILGYEMSTNRFYKAKIPLSDSPIEEKEFWEIYKPIEYKYNFEDMLVS